MGAPAALGAAAPRVIQALLCVGDPLRRERPTDRGSLCVGGYGPAHRWHHRDRDGVVRRRSGARLCGRMAPERSLAARLDAARPAVALALDPRMARQRLRLAWEPDARARIAGSDLGRLGLDRRLRNRSNVWTWRGR